MNPCLTSTIGMRARLADVERARRDGDGSCVAEAGLGAERT